MIGSLFVLEQFIQHTIDIAINKKNDFKWEKIYASDEKMKNLNVTMGDFNGGVSTTYGSGTASSLSAVTVTSATAIADLDVSIEGLNSQRAEFGSMMNRLEYTVDNLRNVAQNTDASRSRIMDADYAAESTELARTQIIQQAATAMLAQANQSAQAVLSLLKG